MKNHALRNGLFYGVASIFFVLVLYFIDKGLMFQFTIPFVIGMLIMIYFMYMAGKATRDDQDGLLSFGEALKATFLVFVIGSLIGTIFSYLLINHIDPSLIDIQAEAELEGGMKAAKMFGAGEAALEEAREAMIESQSDKGFGSYILQYFVGLIFGFIFAALTSLVLKRNPKV